VQLLPIPKPLEVPDGWDCGDAIATDGWDFERVSAFLPRPSRCRPMRRRQRLPQVAMTAKKSMVPLAPECSIPAAAPSRGGSSRTGTRTSAGGWSRASW
jgi:hypothetical protein